MACDDRWDLKTSRLELRLKGLGRKLDGFKIVHLTDLHRGPLVPESFIEYVVERANDLQPDLTVLTGDYVSRSSYHMSSCAQCLSKLSAPFGVVAVLGNHDYWTDAKEVTRRLKEMAQIRVLRNQAIYIFVEDAALSIAGLDDPVTAHDDIEQTLAGTPSDVPTVLLAHTPDIIEKAAENHVELVLAGHTHGGQIAVPGFGPVIANSRYGRRYASGLKRLGGTAIYTNRGVGMAVLPIRINCPPEVALITLRSA